MSKPTVLFLCSHNSARSLMAEALLRHHAGEHFEAFSSGLEPTEVNPLTLTVLAERGIGTAGLRSKCTTEFLGRTLISHAIVVCSQAAEKCPQFYPFTVNNLYWPFDDPASFEGSDSARLEKFRSVRDQIEARILGWLDEFPNLKASSHERH